MCKQGQQAASIAIICSQQLVKLQHERGGAQQMCHKLSKSAGMQPGRTCKHRLKDMLLRAAHAV